MILGSFPHDPGSGLAEILAGHFLLRHLGWTPIQLVFQFIRLPLCFVRFCTGIRGCLPAYCNRDSQVSMPTRLDRHPRFRPCRPGCRCLVRQRALHRAYACVSPSSLRPTGKYRRICRPRSTGRRLSGADASSLCPAISAPMPTSKIETCRRRFSMRPKSPFRLHYAPRIGTRGTIGYRATSMEPEIPITPISTRIGALAWNDG